MSIHASRLPLLLLVPLVAGMACGRSGGHRGGQAGSAPARVTAATARQAPSSRDPSPAPDAGGSAADLGASSSDSAESTEIRSMPAALAYPGAKRIPDLEGPEPDGRYRFVMVSSAPVARVERHYRHRFPGHLRARSMTRRDEYLLGDDQGRTTVRITPVRSDLPQLDVGQGGGTLVVVRCSPDPGAGKSPHGLAP